MPFSEELKAAILSWIREKFPSWSGVRVEPYGKYLGFSLGPSAGNQSWSAPWQKYSERIETIAESHAGPTLSAFTYNFKVLPTLSYVAQLCALPCGILQKESFALHRLFHLVLCREPCAFRPPRHEVIVSHRTCRVRGGF